MYFLATTTKQITAKIIKTVFHIISVKVLFPHNQY